MSSIIASSKTLNGFVNLVKTKVAKQTGVLYGSRILTSILALIITPVITRVLGPEKYGVYVFILAVITFAYLFFEFGFFTSGARLLAVSKDREKDRELIGALTLITVGVSLFFSLLLFIFSFFIDSIFHTTAGNILRAISILAAVFPFQYMLLEICQGANEIIKIAAIHIIPRLWYLAGLLITVFFFKLDVFLALVLDFTGTIVAAGLIIWRLKPKISNLKENLILLRKEIKEYGFHVYIGRIIGISIYNLDILFISYFVNTLWVGFYNLALILIRQMVILSQALSTSLFKEFANRDKIPQKVILFNFIWLTCCVFGLILLGKYVVVFLFSDKYLPVVPLILPLSLAGFFQGMYQPYNMFLEAHRKGKWVRNIAIIFAITNLILNFILIQLWGAMGAAIVTLITYILWYILCVYYYNKLLHEDKLKA